jgi:hypothetical protein
VCGLPGQPAPRGALAALQASTDPTDDISAPVPAYAPLAFTGSIVAFGEPGIRPVSSSAFRLASPGTYLVEFSIPVTFPVNTSEPFVPVVAQAIISQRGVVPGNSVFQAAIPTSISQGFGTLNHGFLVDSDGTNILSLLWAASAPCAINADNVATLSITQLSGQHMVDM